MFIEAWVEISGLPKTTRNPEMTLAKACLSRDTRHDRGATSTVHAPCAHTTNRSKDGLDAALQRPVLGEARQQ